MTAPNKAAMLSLPSQKKWQIYCSRKGGEDMVDQAHAPEHYIERLHTLATVRIIYYIMYYSVGVVLRFINEIYYTRIYSIKFP